MTFRISRAARRDLQRISDYWVERVSEDIAVGIISGVMQSFVALASQPNAGLESPSFGGGVRKFPSSASYR